jgi:hypothetical protein
LELQDYDQLGIDVGPDPENTLEAHADFARKHQRARDQYEQTRQQHINLVEEVERLFKTCHSPN